MNATANVAAASSGEPRVREDQQSERHARDLVAGLAGDLRDDDAAELADGEDVAHRGARSLTRSTPFGSTVTRRTPSPRLRGPAGSPDGSRRAAHHSRPAGSRAPGHTAARSRASVGTMSPALPRTSMTASRTRVAMRHADGEVGGVLGVEQAGRRRPRRAPAAYGWSAGRATAWPC